MNTRSKRSTNFIAAASSQNGSVVAYDRVSNPGQERSAWGTNGSTTQRHAMNRWARRNRRAISAFYHDHGVSGWKPQARQLGLERLISNLRRGDVILVQKCDRFSRNCQKARGFLNQIHRKGATVFSVGEEIDSRNPQFMLRIQAAEWSAEAQSQTAKDFWARKRAGISNADEEWLPEEDGESDSEYDEDEEVSASQQMDVDGSSSDDESIEVRILSQMRGQEANF